VSAQGTNPKHHVSHDGLRFLIVKPAEKEQSAPPQINVLLNWFVKLNRSMPTGMN
jgi:hypothetical protein